MADKTAAAIRISFEDYLREYADKRYEYVEGHAVPMGELVDKEGAQQVTPTRLGHGRISGRIHVLLGNYVMTRDLGEVLSAETGFIMSHDPPEMRAADVAFVTKQRLAELESDDDWLSGPPDLAVEIVSEHDRASDVRAKAAAYVANGTRLLWVVYPASHVVDVYRPGQPVTTLSGDDTLDGGDVVPGFTLALAKIFEP